MLHIYESNSNNGETICSGVYKGVTFNGYYDSQTNKLSIVYTTHYVPDRKVKSEVRRELKKYLNI